MRRPYEERFWSRVRKTSRCWLWTADCSDGYGHFTPSPTSGARMAHRIAYELLVGPIPEGMRLNHSCQNPQCVKPAHLRLLTHSESAAEASSHVRRVRHPLVCRNGHVRTPENTTTNSRGQTVCRTCQRATNRRAYERKKRLKAPTVEIADPIDSREVAALLGLSYYSVSPYRHRYEDFPEPVGKNGPFLLWRRRDVEHWAKARGRLPR